MAKKPDNPSAFPEIATDFKYNDDRELLGADTYSYGGMSLRDYFAAKAMNGILAGDDTMDDAKKLARWSYELADAMLEARTLAARTL